MGIKKFYKATFFRKPAPNALVTFNCPFTLSLNTAWGSSWCSALILKTSCRAQSSNELWDWQKNHHHHHKCSRLQVSLVSLTLWMQNWRNKLTAPLRKDKAKFVKVPCLTSRFDYHVAKQKLISFQGISSRWKMSYFIHIKMKSTAHQDALPNNVSGLEQQSTY